jgi:uncharacterized protein YceK
MRKKSKSILAIFLLFIVLATCVSGCAGSLSRKTYDRNASPFDTNRVATVRIVMKEKDWESLRANAFEEQYVPADF